MSNPHASPGRNGLWHSKAGKAPSPLTLLRSVPSEWQHDRPAYAGDPFMDWESLPEPPRDDISLPDQATTRSRTKH